MAGLSTNAPGLWGGFAGLLYGSTSLSTPPGFLADATTPFSPASLFAASEPGVWYDPSDFSTMFQDSAGTTPVTAVEQPVGLLLDKSKWGGRTLAQEFATGPLLAGLPFDAAPWTSYLGNATFTATSVTTTIGGRGAAVPVTPGAFYKVEGQTGSLTGNWLLIAEGVGTIYRGTFPANGSINCIFQATSGTLLIYNTSASGTVNFSSLTIKLLPGNHATQATSASRPVLSARVNLLTYSEQFDNPAWTKVGVTAAGARITANAGTSAAYSQISVLNTPAASLVISVVFPSLPGRHRYVWVADRGIPGIASATFDLDTISVIGSNAGVTASASMLSDGSVRCLVTYTRASVGSSSPQFALAGASHTSDRPSITWAGGEFVDAKIDIRVANTGVGLPAYQAVVTSTNYDTTGFPYYLRFDGTDDSLATSTITPGIDKAQVFSGVRKQSDAAQGILAEWSATIASNNGTFLLAAPDDASATFAFDSKGTAQVDAVASALAAPLTGVVSGLGDIAGDTATIRVNGVQVDQDTGDQGTGNYLAYPLYIGRRGGTTLPFNGNLYSLIVRFGANLDATTISNTETWVNGKTMAYGPPSNLVWGAGDYLVWGSGNNLTW